MASEKKLVVLLINGYGISLGLKGNAIVAAKPQTFSDLWTNQKHCSILPTKSSENYFEPIDRSMQYARLGAGIDLKTSAELIAEALKNNLFISNEQLQNSFNYTKRHSSSLQLICVLSKSEINLQIRSLQHLLRAARAGNVFKINIHVIIDADWKTVAEFTEYLTKIEAVVFDSHIGQVISITGGYYISDFTTNKNRLNDFFDLLVRADGRRYLSSRQLFSRHLKENPFMIAPSIILPESDRYLKLKSFDAVIISSLHNNYFSQFIKSFEKLRIGGSKQLAVFLLQNASSYSYLEIKSIFCPQIKTSLIRKIKEAGLLSALISEDFRLDYLKQNFLFNAKSNASFMINTPPKGSDYLQKYKNINKSILNKSVEVIKNGKFDFILIDLPCLERVAGLGSFADLANCVIAIDDFIKAIKDVILENGYSLMLTSLYGMAEKLAAYKFPGTMVSYAASTRNPLPLVLVSGHKNDAAPSVQHGIHEIVNESGNVSSIPATVLDFFGIDKAQEMDKKLFKK